MFQEKSYKKRKQILDIFGKLLIENVRDTNLKISSTIVDGTVVNPIKKEQYSGLSNLTNEQKSLVNQLLDETITSTLFDFMDMFDEYNDEMKLIFIVDDEEYDLAKISDKMGAEITFSNEEGWIQMFSKLEMK